MVRHRLATAGVAVLIVALGTSQPAHGDDTVIKEKPSTDGFGVGWGMASDAYGSSIAGGCSWQHVGSATVDATPGVIGGDTGVVVVDRRDPATGRMIYVYRDCNGAIRQVLQPSGAEAATILAAELLAPIPLPRAGILPGAENTAVVNVDLWTWLENPEPFTNTGSAIGTTITIKAKPTKIETNWGDGTTTTCDAPGADYTKIDHPKLARDKDEQPGGCGHRYKQHSGKQPDKKYTITTTVTWTATWSASTGEKDVPFSYVLTRTATKQLKVVQVQAINTSG
jgi:hypothetical protein